MGAVAVFMVVLVLVAFIAIPAYLIWDHMTNPLWHNFHCLCGRCDLDRLRRKIERREYDRREREQRAAVDELYRESDR